MSSEVLFVAGLLAAIAAWRTLQYAIALRRSLRQRHIGEVGVSCQGRVVAIQRPFMLDDCTRLYFDFVPAGAEEPVRGCHIAHCLRDQSSPTLPVQGTLVTVRYLPEQPHRALIAL